MVDPSDTFNLSNRMHELAAEIGGDLKEFVSGSMPPEDFQLRLQRHRNQLLCAIEDEEMTND